MVTTQTLVINMQASVRLRNALVSRFPNSWRTLTVGDVLSLSDVEVLRLPNIGLVTLREWKRLTAHLRGGSVEEAEEESEEERIRKQLRTTLNTIAGAHKTLARLYKELAEIALPVDQK